MLDPESKTKEGRIGRGEALRAAGYGFILLWMNAYICRELFTKPLAHMNSMHGFWAALARMAGNSWFSPSWWPYWDCGIPFEYAYAPLVPALIAAWSAIRGVSQIAAFHTLSGVVYCLLPLTLFVAGWLLTRAPGYAFFAALFYSLTAPTQWIVPDSGFSVKSIWDARRLYVLGEWDDTPHALALTFLPLAIVLLSLSMRRPRLRYLLPAAVLIAAMAAASEFGAADTGMAALCLLVVLRDSDWKRKLAVTAGVGAVAYAIVAPFLPPSLLLAIRQASAEQEYRWSPWSIVALVLIAAGWLLLAWLLPRWIPDWRPRFFILFTWLVSAAPVVDFYFHHQILPQPGRYKLEMELALALLLVLAVKHWADRASPAIKVALVIAILVVAGRNVVSHRRYAKQLLQPRDITQTIEYRAAVWAGQNLPGVRVMFPGSMAQWADAFTTMQQFTGGSWSKAANAVQQRGREAIVNGGPTPAEDARVSLAWLEAYGVAAVAVSGPHSAEFWKPYSHPEKFEGVLPLLWRADDVSIYRVPQRTNSLAHVVPKSALVGDTPRDAAGVVALEKFDAALQDPMLPSADFRWEGRNRFFIRTAPGPGQVVAVQVSYHPGWHARTGGRAYPVHRDALGLMWIEPACAGPCEVQMTYDGGLELRAARYLSWTTMAGLVLLVLLRNPLRHAFR